MARVNIISLTLSHLPTILLAALYLQMPFISVGSCGVDVSRQKCWNKYDTIWIIEQDVSSHKDYILGLFHYLKNYILKNQGKKNISFFDDSGSKIIIPIYTYKSIKY